MRALQLLAEFEASLTPDEWVPRSRVVDFLLDVRNRFPADAPIHVDIDGLLLTLPGPNIVSYCDTLDTTSWVDLALYLVGRGEFE